MVSRSHLFPGGRGLEFLSEEERRPKNARAFAFSGAIAQGPLNDRGNSWKLPSTRRLWQGSADSVAAAESPQVTLEIVRPGEIRDSTQRPANLRSNQNAEDLTESEAWEGEREGLKATVASHSAFLLARGAGEPSRKPHGWKQDSVLASALLPQTRPLTSHAEGLLLSSLHSAFSKRINTLMQLLAAVAARARPPNHSRMQQFAHRIICTQKYLRTPNRRHVGMELLANR